MAFTARSRLVNPRLGTYFGIFTAALIRCVRTLLLLAAEAGFAGYAAAWILGQSERTMSALVVACTAGIVLLGGMRSLTWSSVAKAIAALLALAVCASIVATMIS